MTSRLIGNFGFDQFREENERFLPAEITRFGGNGRGDSFLNDSYLCAAKDLFQVDGRLHFAGQCRDVKFAGVTDALVRLEFDIRSSKGVARAGREVGKG